MAISQELQRLIDEQRTTGVDPLAAGAVYLGEDYDDVVAARKARGTISLSGIPADGDILTVNGTDFVFGTDIDIEEDIVTQAETIATALNASVDADVALATYTASGAEVYVVADTGGIAGNAFTLSENSDAIDTPETLSGGAAASTRLNEVIKTHMRR